MKYSRTKVRKTREVFTASNKVLYKARYDEVPEVFEGIMQWKGFKAREMYVHALAKILIEDGYYAKPINYNPDRPGTFRQTRYAVMGLAYRQYRANNADRIKKGDRHNCFWEEFCKLTSFDPVAVTFR